MEVKAKFENFGFFIFCIFEFLRKQKMVLDVSWCAEQLFQITIFEKTMFRGEILKKKPVKTGFS